MEPIIRKKDILLLIDLRNQIISSWIHASVNEETARRISKAETHHQAIAILRTNSSTRMPDFHLCERFPELLEIGLSDLTEGGMSFDSSSSLELIEELGFRTIYLRNVGISIEELRRIDPESDQTSQSIEESINRAYEEISQKSEVYKSTFTRLSYERQMIVLSHMLKWFEDREEYEKCAVIHSIMKGMKTT